MRIDERKLVRLALLVLEDAAARCRYAPVERTFGVRLALAYLATKSGDRRWPFDHFWEFMIEDDKYVRSANMLASINGIYVGLGMMRDYDDVGMFELKARKQHEQQD